MKHQRTVFSKTLFLLALSLFIPKNLFAEDSHGSGFSGNSGGGGFSGFNPAAAMMMSGGNPMAAMMMSGMGGGGGGGTSGPSPQFQKSMDAMTEAEKTLTTNEADALKNVTTQVTSSMADLNSTIQKATVNLPDQTAALTKAATLPDSAPFYTSMNDALAGVLKTLGSAGATVVSGIQARGPKAPDAPAKTVVSTLGAQFQNLPSRGGQGFLGSAMAATNPKAVTPPEMSNPANGGPSHAIANLSMRNLNELQKNTYAFPEGVKLQDRALEKR